MLRLRLTVLATIVVLVTFASVAANSAQSETITISYRVMASPANWKLSGTAGTICRIYWSDGVTPAKFVVAHGLLDTTLAEENLNIGFVEGETCAVEGFIQVPRHDSYTIKITPYFSQTVTIDEVVPGTRLRINLVESDEVVNAEMLPTPTPTPWVAPTPKSGSEDATPAASPYVYQAPDFVVNANGTPIPSEHALGIMVRQPLPDSLDIEEGDGCPFDFGDTVFEHGPAQIVVRDEHDTIVALLDLYGSVVPTSAGWQCTLETWIELPAASFYTVYLGNQYLRSYQESDFPIWPADNITFFLPEWGS